MGISWYFLLSFARNAAALNESDFYWTEHPLRRPLSSAGFPLTRIGLGPNAGVQGMIGLLNSEAVGIARAASRLTGHFSFVAHSPPTRAISTKTSSALVRDFLRIL